MRSTIAVVGAALGVLIIPVSAVIDSSVPARERDALVARVALLAVFALVTAAMLATLQARSLARPLERLARSAGRVGDGDFSAPPVASGIAEIDDISRSLRLSATRVDRMLESERGFTADATHQLRTGLTGLALRLELLQRRVDSDAAAEVTAILDQTHELNGTLDSLLAVARTGSTGERTEVDLDRVVTHHVEDWRPSYERGDRQVVVVSAPSTPVRATPGLVGQIVDVLLGNALEHGGGTVTVVIGAGGVVVEDEGAGVAAESIPTLFERPPDHRAAHGRGLALARRLAESDGGRLELSCATPAAFTLRYPPARGVREAASVTATPRTSLAV